MTEINHYVKLCKTVTTGNPGLGFNIVPRENIFVPLETRPSWIRKSPLQLIGQRTIQIVDIFSKKNIVELFVRFI